MIALEAVHKSFADKPVIRGLDLTVAGGESVALVGPSGCGKSTILRLVIGLTRPDSGIVRFDRQALTDADLMSVRRRTGYVIQDGGLFPHLTARGNVTLMARELHWQAAAIAGRLAELAELTHFPLDGLDRYPTELSGGQRQRVALMRALMLDPDVLLLDEPLGALDPLIRFDLQRDLRDIIQRLGKTVVLVTHDLSEAAYLGDRLVLLRDGEIVQQGRLGDLQAEPASNFVSRFVAAQRSHTETQRSHAESLESHRETLDSPAGTTEPRPV
jgi:osmoprotectant transport system ATP-binding protein